MRRIEEFISATAPGWGPRVLLGSEPNKQHGRVCVFHLHESISAAVCMEMSDSLEIRGDGSAELAREQTKGDGGPNLHLCAGCYLQ